MENTQGNEYPNFSLRITEEKKQFLRIIYPLIIIGEEQKYKHDDTNLSPHALYI